MVIEGFYGFLNVYSRHPGNYGNIVVKIPSFFVVPSEHHQQQKFRVGRWLVLVGGRDGSVRFEASV